MQFLRSDNHHVDSCWITWNHPETRMKVTIYPMLHIGHEGFYRRVSEELLRCDYVLHEGVTWRTGDRRRPLYDLVARNLGVAAQESVLSIPDSAKRVNLDMPRAEFRQRLFRLPLRYVATIMFLRPILWLLTLPPPLRQQFIQHGLLGKHRRLAVNETTPLEELIVTARDRRIVESLQSFYHSHGYSRETIFTGVVFGAGHMPAICAGLRALGFRAATRRWVEVYRRAEIAPSVA